MKYLFVNLLCLIMISSAPAWAQGGFNGPSKVAGYDVGDSGQLIVRLAKDSTCSRPIYYISRNDPWYSDALAIVISAYNSGSTVNLYVGSCDANGAHVVRLHQGGVWY